MTPQHRPPSAWDKLTRAERRAVIDGLFAAPAPVEPPAPREDEFGRPLSGPNPWTPTPLRGVNHAGT